MDQETDVVVVGGGVIGICVAYYLQRAGRQVTVLERDYVCSGSSYGNSGLIVPSHSIPLPVPGVVYQALKWMLDEESPFYVKPRLDLALISWLWDFRSNCTVERMGSGVRTLLELSSASRGLYDQLLSDENIECSYQKSGLFMLYSTERGYEEGVQEGKLMAGAGLSMVEMDASEVVEMEPAIRTDIIGGVYYPEDACLNPLAFVRGLADRVQEIGGSVKEGVEVLGFETRAGAVKTVKTTDGDYHPNEVVLAAGSWSPSLAKGLNLKLPVQAAKGYSVTFDRKSSPLKHALILGEARVGVNPMGEKLRLAGTLELSGLDLSINARRVDAVVAAARRYLNCGETFSNENTWAGLRPMTPDGVPVVGRVTAHPNLVVATGHATVGVTLGPVTGKLVSEIVCNQTHSVDSAAVSPNRFH